MISEISRFIFLSYAVRVTQEGRCPLRAVKDAGFTCYYNAQLSLLTFRCCVIKLTYQRVISCSDKLFFSSTCLPLVHTWINKTREEKAGRFYYLCAVVTGGSQARADRMFKPLLSQQGNKHVVACVCATAGVLSVMLVLCHLLKSNLTFFKKLEGSLINTGGDGTLGMLLTDVSNVGL